ncbi:hypothetical protein GW17_00061175 [Ensete ventricosum]|nr:hypothetical protein GW17_00061175 [Ensete ventricosum]
MHPLRFPYSGIRAKRKYVLPAGMGGHMHVVCMQRWLAMAKPPAGVAGHELATCKGRPIAARPPARGGRPQGQQPTRGDHPRARPAAASPVASKGGKAGRRGGSPLAGRRPIAKGSHRLRRGNNDDGAVRVNEG